MTAAAQRLPTGRTALVLLVASLCFATSGPLGKYAAPLHPVWIGVGRCLLAGVLLGGMGRRHLAGLGALPRRARRLVLLSGAVLGAHFALFLAGLRLTSLPAAITLVSLEPVSVVLIATIAFRSLPTRSEIAGVCLATVGALLVARAAGQGDHTLTGDLVVVGAVVLYGVYVALSRAIGGEAHQAALSVAVYAGATMTLTATALALRLPIELTPSAAWAVVALGIVPTLGGHTLVQWSASRMPPSRVALVSPGETVGGLAISAALAGALPSTWEALGALVIVLGVLVTLRR